MYQMDLGAADTSCPYCRRVRGQGGGGEYRH
jgi:hypothetical protein